MMLEDKLARAKDVYRVKLIERLETLHALLARLRQEMDHETLHEAQRMAHRICGTAGTFGFADAGEAVAVIDQTLLSLREDKVVASGDLWDWLELVLRRAREASQGSPRGSAPERLDPAG